MLLAGYSIARLGDGEFKLIDGVGYVREPPNPKLAAEMKKVLRHHHEKCIVGLPTMDPAGPKYLHWARHRDRFSRLLRKTSGPFFSAFISRPDSAPWIRNREFAEQFASLWAGKKIAAVCTLDNSLLRALQVSKAAFTWIACPFAGAYAVIDALEKDVVKTAPDIALLSCGPTATCLANRLAARGIQAIDFGSGGSFIAKLLS